MELYKYNIQLNCTNFMKQKFNCNKIIDYPQILGQVSFKRWTIIAEITILGMDSNIFEYYSPTCIFYQRQWSYTISDVFRTFTTIKIVLICSKEWYIMSLRK